MIELLDDLPPDTVGLRLVRHLATVGRLLIPARLRLFAVAELDQAKAWVSARDD
jgi:hypothetical protein